MPPAPFPPAAPPGPKWARKRFVIPAAVALLLLGVGIGSAGGDGTDGRAGARPTATKTVTAPPKAALSDQADAAPTPTVTVTKTVKPKPAKTRDTSEDAPSGKAVFKVWGSAPSGVEVTYGSDGTNLQGKGLPLEKTLTVKDDALYYQVTAQLMGGGDIRCSVTIDGRTKSGRAQGGYNICSAQLNSDFGGGFS
ncbi:hypothetical protein AB0K80_12405 [Streptomyces sp. NPDC052682]|uniref:hypothetical protein n=1 Tax=Streptomyces sp. NPDC052682 TaxID=3154954 RepID=UPI0034334DB1